MTVEGPRWVNDDAAAHERLRRAALLAGLQDWFDVRFMAGVLEDLEPDLAPDDVQRIVIATVRDMAAEGLVTIGSLDSKRTEVIAWSSEPVESIERLDAEWDVLIDPKWRMGDPSLTLDGFLSNTEKGDDLARWMRGTPESLRGAESPA